MKSYEGRIHTFVLSLFVQVEVSEQTLQKTLQTGKRTERSQISPLPS